MKHAGGGFKQSYNARTVVDAERQIIVAAELSNNAADSGQLPDLLAAVQANLKQSQNQPGFRQFSLRGLENVKGELNLVAMAWHLKQIFDS